MNPNLVIESYQKEPFHALCLDNFFIDETYQKLKDEFPLPEELPDICLTKVPRVGHKYHLSSKLNTKDFHNTLNKCPNWKQFYQYTQSKKFLQDVDKVYPFLSNHSVEFVRFEFSYLPANGGFIYPHPDVAKKIITLVLYFPYDWEEEWGGGFCTLKHKEKPNGNFNGRGNGDISWNEVDTIREFEFIDNRCMIMIRSKNSLHCVKPIRGPSGVYRKSVTINIVGKRKK